MVSRPGILATAGSSEPSGPVVGPEIRRTSTPGFWRRPRTEATVFSCAPPTTSRVMMWVTRMGRASMRMAFEFAEPPDDIGGFVGVGVRAGQIQFVIPDHLIRVVLAPGDFA